MPFFPPPRKNPLIYLAVRLPLFCTIFRAIPFPYSFSLLFFLVALGADPRACLLLELVSAPSTVSWFDDFQSAKCILPELVCTLDRTAAPSSVTHPSPENREELFKASFGSTPSSPRLLSSSFHSQLPEALSPPQECPDFVRNLRRKALTSSTTLFFDPLVRALLSRRTPLLCLSTFCPDDSFTRMLGPTL